MANFANKVKSFINKIKDIFKKFVKIIKLFMTPIGHILAIILLVIFVVLLFKIIGDIVGGSIATFFGYDWNYDTYTDDKKTVNDFINNTSDKKNQSSKDKIKEVFVSDIVKEINDSGYGSMINASNYQNFKAFEYAVLMDAAEYLRTNKQEMFDIAKNEGEYAFERSLLEQRKPEKYKQKLSALSKKYANVGGKTGEDASVKLLETSYTSVQSLASKDKLEVLTSNVDENVNENEIQNVWTSKGGNNRVKGPFITYEFKGVNKIDNDTPSSKSYVTVDPKKITDDNVKKIWKKYSNEILSNSAKYGIDPYMLLAVIAKDSNGELNKKTKNEDNTDYSFGLIQIPNQNTNKDKLKKFEVTDVTNTSLNIDCTEEGTVDEANAQIEAGAAYLRKCIEASNYNVHDGIGSFVLGESKYKDNPEAFNEYWKSLKERFFGDKETWIIKKDGKKYYSYFTNMETGKYTKKTNVTNSINEEEIQDISKPKESEITKTSGTDTLEPYIYIIKEDIDFSYYIDDSNSVIQYPLLLNANNSKLNVGQENGEEINRALLGISPVVWPGEYYTQTPYYSDKTNMTIYKIPLRTLIGRYLPKQELLLTWSLLKQNIDKETTGITEKDFMDYVIDSIKGIYNEACLDGEEFETEEAERQIIDKDGQLDSEIVNYSRDKSHKKTFVTFAKVGLETTKYDINGLQPLTNEDGNNTVKVVTDFVNAIVIKSKFKVTYTYNPGINIIKPGSVSSSTINDINYIHNEPKALTLPGTNRDNSLTDTGTGSAQTGTTTNPVITKTDEAEFSLSDLGDFGGTEGEVILAQGDMENGYTPPCSLDGQNAYYIIGGTEKDIEGIKEKIIDAITEKIDENNVSVTLPDDVVTYNPIFIASDPIKVKKKLKIVHTRMPALLVTSAKTWCREVKFEHNIVQNQFKQNNASYIKPNSKMGTGLTVFETKVTDNGYRGKAYSEVFSKLQEKDLVNMLLQLEKVGDEGFDDAYEFMRDLYKLAKVSQQYSISKNFKAEDSHFIHPNTYAYVYLPQSIAKYNDLESQKIYWLNLLTATADDPITNKEIKKVRTRNKPLSWQVVEYDKYSECNKNGITKVYALSPFGSPYLRTYYETMYIKNQKVNGSFKEQGHSGADWAGRAKLNDILETESATTNNKIGKSIYNYEYKRLAKITTEANAKQQLQDVLKEQIENNPIVAVAPGIVERVAYSDRAGFYVRVLHSEYNGAYSYYVHLKRWPEVSVGDYIGAGTIIGYEGNTGRSFGSHLHFQLKIAGDIKSPEKYIFPTFNPFYYEERAAEDNYALESEYMSLERTVRMVSKSDKKIINRVPKNGLVNNYAYLIENQGNIERQEKYSGSLNWSDKIKGETIDDYIEYLNKKKFNDLCLEPAFFDRKLAKEQKYLEVPEELLAYLYGNIIVKIDMAGSLPALTEEELKIIIDTWLPARYNAEEVKWLMNNVFSPDNIKAIIEYQNQYKVSAVFALAVATQEQQLGLCENGLSRKAHNIFSITTSSSTNYFVYQNGRHWRKYASYKDAFEDFMRLIGESGSYFKEGKYTIGAIAPTYCNGDWGKAVSRISLEIMKYYTGNDWSMPDGEINVAIDNSGFLGLAGTCIKWLALNDFSYDYSGGYIPYKNLNADGSFGQKKDSTIDCSTYVSWVLYEYGRINGIEELTKFGDHNSEGFQKIADGADKSAYTKYFDVAWHGSQGLGASGKSIKDIHELLQPGDILIYRRNELINRNEATGHVDIFAGWVKEDSTSDNSIYKFSCGKATGKSSSPTSYNTSKEGKPYASTMPMQKKGGSKDHGFWDITGVIRLNTGNIGSITDSPVDDTSVGNDGKGISAGSEKSTGENKKYLIEDELFDVDKKKVEEVYDGGDTYDAPDYSSSAGEALINICKKTIQYMKKNSYKYYKDKNGKVLGDVHIPPYNSLNSDGSYGTPKDSSSKRYIDCVRYVMWVLHEYGRENDIPGLMRSGGPSDYIPAYYNIANGSKDYSWGKYFNTIYCSKGLRGPSLEKEKPKEWIMETLKPGDILVYTADRTGQKPRNHIDIFAGFTSDGSLKVYSCGFTPDKSEYGRGEPVLSSTGCRDITAVLRLKGETLKNKSDTTSEAETENKNDEEIIGLYERQITKYEEINGKKFNFYMYTPETITTNMPLIVFTLGEAEYDKIESAKSKSTVLNQLAKKAYDLNAILVVPELHLSGNNPDYNENKARIDAIYNGLKNGFVDKYGRKLKINPNKTAFISFSMSNQDVLYSKINYFKVYAFLSSFSHKNAGSLKNAKKVFVYNAAKDTEKCKNASNVLYENLKKQKVDVEYRTVEGSHGSVPYNLFSNSKFLNEILSSMK